MANILMIKIFFRPYLSAKKPKKADPVMMPRKWKVPTRLNFHWFSSQVMLN